MSAFLVSKAHIDALVSLTLQAKQHGAPFSFWWSPGLGDNEVGTVYDVDYENVDAIGKMLWLENVASLDARYGGRAVDDAERAEVAGYAYTTPPKKLSLVEGLKAIDCYEYQACEHDGWEKSKAKAFCAALRKALIYKLPGYDAAAWGI